MATLSSTTNKWKSSGDFGQIVYNHISLYLLKYKFSSRLRIFLQNSPDVETIDPIQLRTHLTHIASMGNYLPEVSLG